MYILHIEILLNWSENNVVGICIHIIAYPGIATLAFSAIPIHSTTTLFRYQRCSLHSPSKVRRTQNFRQLLTQSRRQTYVIMTRTEADKMWTWQECYRSGLCPDVSSELLETTAEFYGVQPVIRAFPRKIRMDDYVSKAPSFSENVFSLDTAPKENNICHAFSVLTMPPAHTELIPAKNESMKEGLFDGGKRYAYIFFIFVFINFVPAF